MSIDFQCANCRRSYRVADSLAGKRVACKQCGQPILIPAAAQDAPVAAAQPAPSAASPAAPKPYGVAPDVASGPMRRKPNIVFIIGAVAMFGGFFLPWISIDAGILSMYWGAYQLPYAFNSFLDTLIKILQGSTDPEGQEALRQLQDVRARGNFLYVVYLIPALALAAFVDELMAMKKGRNRWWLRALAATSPIIAFIAVTIAFSGLENSQPKQNSSPQGNPFDLFKVLSAGFYISVLGFVAATVGIFTSPKPRPVQTLAFPRKPGAPRPPASMPGVRSGPRPGLKPRLSGKPKLPGPRG